MNRAFSSWCVIALLTLVPGALSVVWAQNPSPTPDPVVTQVTNVPALAFNAFARDMTADGRFIAFESDADIATNNKNNADGNREIFIFDYAQRRIFQLTNTKNVSQPVASPTPTPSPTPIPGPQNTATIKIEISNARPVFTYAPAADGSGNRVYSIVFSSNAPNPANFDGTDSPALGADANQELWIYQLPPVSDVDLSTGADLPVQDLTTGTFTQITNTPASRIPVAGKTGVAPFVADDNRDATITDNGNIIAFISTRDLVPAVGNADGNPELFFYNKGTSTFVQATNTRDETVGNTIFTVFQENPCLSADGSVVAFVSNGDLTDTNDDDGQGHGNAEIFVANFSGSGISNLHQATRTKTIAGTTVNLLSPGRRLSRDGAFLAFESLANDPLADTTTTNAPFLAVFVYNVAAKTFVQVGQRALVFPGDLVHFPTFTDYNGLTPSTLIFASGLNFKTDGTFPPAAEDATGLNPNRNAQVFATQIPATSTNTFTRVSANPAGPVTAGIRPFASSTRKRTSFSLAASELGGGNQDLSTEVYYLLSPTATSDSSAALTFFTGASEMSVPAAADANPTPTPAPSPGIATGLAAGELGIIRSTQNLALTSTTSTNGSEISRAPALPTELNGVTVTVNGAGAGLYFVGAAEKQINFVVPLGALLRNSRVIVNNNGTIFRGFLPIIPAMPDVFTSTQGPGGRAAVVNVTNPMNRTAEPFSVTSPDQSGTMVPTVLEVSVTGIRSAIQSEVTVTIGSVSIAGEAIVFLGPNKNMPGFDLINVTLPSSLAGAGDVPVVVTVNRAGTVFSSRPAATAPHITIGP